MNAATAFALLVGCLLATIAHAGPATDKAWALYNDRVFPALIDAADAAVAAEPNNPLAHLVYGLTLEASGETEEAVAAYKRTLDLTPDELDAIEGIGRLTTRAAGGWRVEKNEEEQWFAILEEDKTYNVRLTMSVYAETPRVLDWRKPVKPAIGLMRYYAGQPGTQYLNTIVRLAIIDLESGDVLGDVVHSELGDRSTWNWEEDVVTVSEPYGDITRIELPQ